jgi:hypothetical protein
MRIAASHGGDDVKITPFPMGENPNGLDRRPVAQVVFTADATMRPTRCLRRPLIDARRKTCSTPPAAFPPTP